jgi:hypothetical protein
MKVRRKDQTKDSDSAQTHETTRKLILGTRCSCLPSRTTKQKVVTTSGRFMTRDPTHTVQLPPSAGAAALVGGIVLSPKATPFSIPWDGRSDIARATRGDLSPERENTCRRAGPAVEAAFEKGGAAAVDSVLRAAFGDS